MLKVKYYLLAINIKNVFTVQEGSYKGTNTQLQAWGALG